MLRNCWQHEAQSALLRTRVDSCVDVTGFGQLSREHPVPSSSQDFHVCDYQFSIFAAALSYSVISEKGQVPHPESSILHSKRPKTIIAILQRVSTFADQRHGLNIDLYFHMLSVS